MTNRISGYTFVHKKIFAPLELQTAPSLLRTSFHHCRDVLTMPTHRYRYKAKRLYGVHGVIRRVALNDVGAHMAHVRRVTLFSIIAWAHSLHTANNMWVHTWRVANRGQSTKVYTPLPLHWKATTEPSPKIQRMV